MKKFWLSITMACLLCVSTTAIVSPIAHAEEGAKVTLTEAQREEMKQLQQEVLERKKVIINKYVEYGVLPEEKGQKIIAHMEERFAKLENEGLIPKWDKKYKKHRKGHE